ncbi:DDE-type integrase/transposase/recombinase [Sulfitobacter sp. W027]|uniref:DDE-type integrase/transposase/recombinase n=1 Tax=Sulfitobacter sp. W027 TaxID=2867025 RepID=UPI0021A5B0CE|nr:DDE-type integrase/transposase/recombinase [Sulfitobacter sp. W027]UWR33022.1 DDE-type integrase/transposase/recombinase [Sulfitobacter sp. W027]
MANASNFPIFSLDMHHEYRITGIRYRFIYLSGDQAAFSQIDNPLIVQSYELETLKRLNGLGKIEVIPYGLMPEHLRPVVNDFEDIILAGIPPAMRKRLEMRHAIVQAFLLLKGNGEIKGTDEAIKVNMQRIVLEAEDYLVEEMPEPGYAEALTAYRAGEGRKPKARHGVVIPDHVSPRALRTWVALYKRGGKKALVDKSVKQGNRFSAFTVDERALLARLVNENYMNLQRKTIAMTVIDVKRGFEKENDRRAQDDLAPLRVPGREAIRLFIKRLDKFHVTVARFGQKEAMKKMRAVKTGLETLRPFERVEMDEWCIDLLSILAESGLLDMFSEEELTEIGLTDNTMRWWLVVAIDVRTRVIVGMTLTANPKTSSAKKCLNMVVSDKEAFADAVGAIAPWPGANVPEILAVDNGPAFKAAAFSTTCADLGITKLQTIAGTPSMRAHIERVFRTLSTTLLPRLYGRTFGNVLERSGHPSEERACLSADDIAEILIRYVVDIYHNTPHLGLNGRTPLEQWQADHEDGNFPLKSAPTMRRKRLALGLPLKRVTQQDGIRVMNVRYHSEEVARWFLKNANQQVDVRWLDENIGSIEVKMDGVWQEVAAVSLIFHDVDASTWAAARRALRAKDGKRKEWEEGVIRRALDDIEAINATRGAAYRIMDHAWSEKRLKAVEQEAVANFTVVADRAQLSRPVRGRGQSIEPMAPEGAQEPKSSQEPEATTAEPVQDGAASKSKSNDKPKSEKTAPAAEKPVLKIDNDGDDDVWEFN